MHLPKKPWPLRNERRPFKTGQASFVQRVREYDSLPHSRSGLASQMSMLAAPFGSTPISDAVATVGEYSTLI